MIRQHLTARAPGTEMVLRKESAGWRHYVANVPVNCGTFLEMQLGGSNGPWVTVRYEACLGSGPVESVRVTLYAVGGRIIPDLAEAMFRWPGKEEA